jgi:hypothetical protein
MAEKPITENTLFYGDNLSILRLRIAVNNVISLTLIPPFNSIYYRYSILGG